MKVELIREQSSMIRKHRNGQWNYPLMIREFRRAVGTEFSLVEIKDILTNLCKDGNITLDLSESNYSNIVKNLENTGFKTVIDKNIDVGLNRLKELIVDLIEVNAAMTQDLMTIYRKYSVHHSSEESSIEHKLAS